jgi:hypothetical protein
MTLQVRKDKADIIAKVIDSLYKKLIILLAIDGAFGTYALKYITDLNIVGYLFAIIFIFVSIAIFVTYVKMNLLTKKLERISDE